MRNRRCLITGGAGFLGRGILNRAMREGWNTQFTVLSRDEEKHRVLKSRYPDVQFVIGDVGDPHTIMRVTRGVDYVIHTAALKYIPECEINTAQCVEVNIGGSISLMRALQDREWIEKAVFISTDKAAHPMNAYGMSKAIVERLVRECGRYDEPFVACRYGNVIGSTGSIWPVAKKHVADTGRIKLTDPYMTRFFMSVDEAVSLIVAALDAPNGSVVVPRPRAARMYDIACMLRDELHAEGVDVVGRRPGEKLHEAMLAPNESVTEFRDYYLVQQDVDGEMVGMTSDAPYEWMAPEEFVRIARESETI